jgi:hypothetical protein
MSYGSIYPYSWWGIATDGGFGDIYFDLSEQEISEIDSMLEALQNRADSYENEDATKSVLEDLDDCGLLEDASLVITPTAYSEGILHSTKPPITYGEELVANGSFDTDSVWSKGDGWSISNGIVEFSSGSDSFLRQNNLDISQGVSYELNFELLAISTGSIQVRLGAGNNVVYSTSTIGSHKVVVQSTDSQDDFYIRSISAQNAVIDNVSLKEINNADLTYTRAGTTTRTNAEGNVETVAENVPVINYENGVAGIRISDGAVLSGGFEDLFDPQNGTLFIRCKNLADDGVRRQLILEEPVADDRIVFRYEPQSNRVEAVLRDNGASLESIKADISNTLEYNNYFITWTSGEFKLYVGDTLIQTKTPNITGIQGISNLRTDDFNGEGEILIVYKHVLTQSEITCINSKF